jgi:hypothetical protein
VSVWQGEGPVCVCGGLLMGEGVSFRIDGSARQPPSALCRVPCERQARLCDVCVHVCAFLQVFTCCVLCAVRAAHALSHWCCACVGTRAWCGVCFPLYAWQQSPAPQDTGELPLHLYLGTACTDVDVGPVERLLAAYPTAARVPNGAGMLPLHVALASGCLSAAVVTLLLAQFPDAARTPCTVRGDVAAVCCGCWPWPLVTAGCGLC